MTARWGPWLDEPLERVRTATRAGRLGHAFLVQGPPGWGQEWLAEALAREWLGDPRAAARATIDDVAHPDLRWILPEGKGEQIRIDAVRALAEFAAHTPQIAPRKVAVLNPADALNEQAANALLKTLEEPAGQTQIVLVTDAPAALLPTLRSRCQRLDVKVSPRATVLGWLRERLGPNAPAMLEALAFEYGYAPCAVLDAIEREETPVATHLAAVVEGREPPIAVAHRLAALRLDAVVARFMRYLSALLAAPWARTGHGALPSVGVPRPGQLLTLWEAHLEARRLTLGTANPNPQLLLEGLLFGWRRLVAA